MFGEVFIARISMDDFVHTTVFREHQRGVVGFFSEENCDTVEDFANFLHNVATVTDRLNAQLLEKALVASGLPPTHGKLWAQRLAAAFSCCRDKHRQSITCERLPEPVSRVVQPMRHRCGKGPSPSPPRQIVPVPLIATSPSRSLPSRPEPVPLLEPAAAIRLPQTADEIRELNGLKRGDSGAAASSSSVEICSTQEVLPSPSPTHDPDDVDTWFDPSKLIATRVVHGDVQTVSLNTGPDGFLVAEWSASDVSTSDIPNLLCERRAATIQPKQKAKADDTDDASDKDKARSRETDDASDKEILLRFDEHDEASARGKIMKRPASLTLDTPITDVGELQVPQSVQKRARHRMMWYNARHVHGIVMAPKKQLFQIRGLRSPKTARGVARHRADLLRAPPRPRVDATPARTIVCFFVQRFFCQIEAATTMLGIRRTNLLHQSPALKHSFIVTLSLYP